MQPTTGGWNCRCDLTSKSQITGRSPGSYPTADSAARLPRDRSRRLGFALPGRARAVSPPGRMVPRGGSRCAKRLRALTSQPQQLTLVFDAGASSKANLEKLETGSDHYVTAVRPSYQQALLAEAADHLQEVTLSTGAVVRALANAAYDRRQATGCGGRLQSTTVRRTTTRTPPTHGTLRGNN